MSIVPYKDESSELKRIKDSVENFYQYFRNNYDRFNDFTRFVFVTSMSDSEESLNKTLNRPSLEFNVLESYVSRLRGEFSKHVPSVEVSAKDGKQVDPQLVKVIEDHMRYILDEANKKNLEYNCYTDTLAGGFSSVKVFTSYTGEMSFHQDINIRRVFDPTMVGFDTMAKEDDKSDGAHCFELYPMRKDDFEREFPGVDIKQVKFSTNFDSFHWAYKTNKEDMIIVCDFYEKKVKREKIVRLATGDVLTMKDYNRLLEMWKEEGRIEQPPAIVGKPRTTHLTSIVRYRLIENKILEYTETDYTKLPIIFIDGNSVLVKNDNNYSVNQYTRPIVYQARGAQKMKNYAGQSLVNELETMVQHKWVVPKDGIPPMYKDAYVDPQQANVLVYNAFKDDDPNIPLPPPSPVVRPPIPQEIAQTFIGADAVVQNVLGTFDATLAKLTERDVSGIAIQESMTLSNASAMPYVVNFLKGIQSIANLVLDLIPKIYVTPRTIPILSADGKKSYVEINQEGGMSFDYDKDAIQVKVEAGVNFNVQQSKALNQIISLMNASPIFGQFINAKGLNVILDNVEIRGVDQLRLMADQFMQEMQQAQAMAAQQQKQDPNIMFAQVESQKNQQRTQVEMMKLQQKQQEQELDAQLKVAELELEKKKAQIELLKVLSEVETKKIEAQVAITKADTERTMKAAEIALKASEHASNAVKEIDVIVGGA